MSFQNTPYSPFIYGQGILQNPRSPSEKRCRRIKKMIWVALVILATVILPFFIFYFDCLNLRNDYNCVCPGGTPRSDERACQFDGQNNCESCFSGHELVWNKANKTLNCEEK